MLSIVLKTPNWLLTELSDGSLLFSFSEGDSSESDSTKIKKESKESRNIALPARPKSNFVKRSPIPKRVPTAKEVEVVETVENHSSHLPPRPASKFSKRSQITRRKPVSEVLNAEDHHSLVVESDQVSESEKGSSESGSESEKPGKKPRKPRAKRATKSKAKEIVPEIVALEQVETSVLEIVETPEEVPFKPLRLPSKFVKRSPIPRGRSVRNRSDVPVKSNDEPEIEIVPEKVTRPPSNFRKKLLVDPMPLRKVPGSEESNDAETPKAKVKAEKPKAKRASKKLEKVKESEPEVEAPIVTVEESVPQSVKVEVVEDKEESEEQREKEENKSVEILSRESLEGLTLVALKSLAKEKGLKKYSTLKKADLVELLLNSE